MKIKPYEVQQFLQHPKKKIVLLYGGDHGLVHTYAKKIITTLQKEKDKKELVYLCDDFIKKKNAIEEIFLPSMFQEAFVVNIVKANDKIIMFLEFLLEKESLAKNDTFPHFIILQTEELGVDSLLRKFCEKSDHIAVIPCYKEKNITVEKNILSFIKDNEKTIEKEALEAIVHDIDAEIAQQELEKLFLYKDRSSKSHIVLQDVKEVMCSGFFIKNSYHFWETIINQAFLGNLQTVEEEMKKNDDSNVDTTFFSVLYGHIQKIYCFLLGQEAGEIYEDIFQRIYPPIHFLQKPIFLKQISLWNKCRIETIQSWSVKAELQTRRKNNFCKMFIQILLYKIVFLAKQDESVSNKI